MDRRTAWLPFTLLALVAGGALVPHLVPTSTSSPVVPTAEHSASAPAAPDPTVGSTAFVNELAKLLNVDIGDVALVEGTRKRADASAQGDDAEMIRCFFDLETSNDPTFAKAAEQLPDTWPRCGAGGSFEPPLSKAAASTIRAAIDSASKPSDARARENAADRDEPVGRSIKRAASSLRSGERTLDGAVIDEAVAKARRRMAFLTVRHAAALHFSEPAPFTECRPESVQFVVATVPDPVDSYARWQFDPTLSAITEAATADGYLQTRFYFPDITAPPMTPKPSEVPLHERFPGVVLFRHDQTSAGQTTHRLFVLLLAYETATDGVHTGALASALRIVLDWHRSDAACLVASQAKADPILMLAPTFSGSSESIVRVLDGLTPQLGRRRVRIVSGSANASTNQRIFRRNPLVDFGATVYPNAVLLDAMWTYLSTVVDPRVRASRSVAWLVESNTTYGYSLVMSLVNPGLRQDATLLQSADSADHVISFFPLHLSRVRPGSAAPPSSPALPPRFGPLNLDDPTRFTDQLPLVSEGTTRSYLELTLSQTLQRLKMARVGYVGLLATDARDKLFLAREIAKETPNVVLFTTESDILYSHPDFYSGMAGMLIASPYPLEAGQVLIGRSHGAFNRQFPESTMVGVYNALTMLLNYDTSGTQIRWNVPGLLWYGEPSCVDNCRPPIWISVIGRDGPRPIWRTDPPRNFAPPEGPIGETANELNTYLQVVRRSLPSERVRTEPEPRIAVGTRERLIVILGAFAILILAWLAFRKKPDDWSARGPYLLAGYLALLPVSLLFAVFAAMWWQPMVQPTVVVSALVMAVAMITVAAPAVRIGVNSAWKKEHWSIVPTTAIAIMTVALGFFLASQWADPKLFVDRLSNWLDGVSPALPIVALALACGVSPIVECFRDLRGEPFGINERAYIEALLGQDNANAEAEAKAKAVALRLACLNEPVLSLKGRPAAIAAALVAALVVFGFDPIIRPLITIDGRAMGEYLTIGLLVVQTMIVVAMTQFVCLWRHVSTLLEHVAALGLEKSFKALPDNVFPTGAVPWTPVLNELTYGIELWRRLPSTRTRLNSKNENENANEKEKENELLKIFDEDLAKGPRTMLLGTATWKKLLDYAKQTAGDLKRERTTRRAADTVAAGAAVPSGSHIVQLAAALGVVPSSLFEQVYAAEYERRTSEAERRASETERRDRDQFTVFPFVLVVRVMLARMWDNLALAAGVIALAAVALWGYHLQMKDALLALLWCDVIAVVAIVLYVFVRMEMNELLSHVTSTTPGEIAWNRDFIVKLLFYGLVPLIGLFATQFPNLAGTIVHWIEPVQKALP